MQPNGCQWSEDKMIRPSPAPPPFDSCVFDTIFLVDKIEGDWPEIFGIVTAHNPPRTEGMGPLSPQEQEARAALLRDRLNALALQHFPVTGASRDRKHQEPGHGIATEDLSLIASLAREFEQWGFFWVEGDEVFVCVDDSGEGWLIDSWRERIRAR